MRFCIVGPCGSGDVQMCPFGLVDELLDKHSTHNSSGLSTRADILDVGDVRLDLLAVFLSDRKLPKVFAGFLAASNDLVNQTLIVAHNACVYIAQGNNDGTG